MAQLSVTTKIKSHFALQWLGDNADEILLFCAPCQEITFDFANDRVLVKKSVQKIWIGLNDWLLVDADGNLGKCSDADFKNDYMVDK